MKDYFWNLLSTVSGQAECGRVIEGDVQQDNNDQRS